MPPVTSTVAGVKCIANEGMRFTLSMLNTMLLAQYGGKVGTRCDMPQIVHDIPFPHQNLSYGSNVGDVHNVDLSTIEGLFRLRSTETQARPADRLEFLA